MLVGLHVYRQFSHNFSEKGLLGGGPNFPLLLPEFREKNNGKFGQKAMANSGKSNGNSGKCNGKIWALKLGKRRHYFGQKLLLLPEFPITFPLISHCFCPNFLFLFPYFPLLSPEFPIAFARISHCFCPNFSFSKWKVGMATAWNKSVSLRLAQMPCLNAA